MSTRATIVLWAAALAALLVALGVLAMAPRRRRSPPAEESVAAAAPQPAVASPSLSPSPPPPRRPAAAAPAPDAGALPSEAMVMARLHQLGETNPPLTLSVARAGNARFPDSPDAPERTWMLVKSLVNMQRFDEARAEARVMVEKYPGTSWAQDVRRHLLSNPP